MKDLKEFMKHSGELPISAVLINDKYILAIYKGKKSKNDIVIRCREKFKNKWSRIRTPKHIHWVVDLLMKISAEPSLSKKFLNIIEKVWKTIKPISNLKTLKLDEILKIPEKDIDQYKKLSKYSFYDIKFPYLLSKLLMTQEKTNYPKEKITEKIIKNLIEGKDLFSIIKLASMGKL